MNHAENIEKLGGCKTTAELDDVLTIISTLPVKDFPEDIKRSYYKALELLDQGILSNAKIRRRFTRLQQSLFIEGCEDPNSKFIVQLRAVTDLASLQTCMDGYKLELVEQVEGYSEEAKASYKLLVETLLDVLKRSEEGGFMNKVMKRRITRLIFVISNQVLGLGPKKPAAENATPAAVSVAEHKTNKKRAADQMETEAQDVPTATAMSADAEVVVAPREEVKMESIEGILALLKQHASLEAGESKTILDAHVLHAILDFVIELVKETFGSEGGGEAVVGTLTSQKRRLLRRALDRINISDYPLPKSKTKNKTAAAGGAASDTGVAIITGTEEEKRAKLLHLKHTHVMEFLASGESATIKANYDIYFPQVTTTATTKGGKKRRKGEESGEPAARKYTVFVGQLSYYTTEEMLRKWIDEKMGYVPCSASQKGNDESSSSSSGGGGSSNKATGPYQVRLLTDKVSKEEKEAAADPRARVSGKRNCRGMGFVDFFSLEEQGKAIKLLHHAPFNGRIVNVERTEPKLGKAAKQAALAQAQAQTQAQTQDQEADTNTSAESTE